MLLLAAPAETSAPLALAPASAPARAISRVWLRGAGLDEGALVEAVAARLTDKEILAAGQSAGASEGLVALCHVTAQGEQLALEVVLGNGRVYQRHIAARTDGRERAAARLIAATLASIEDETARPDRRDGVLVVPARAPEGPTAIAAPVVNEAATTSVAPDAAQTAMPPVVPAPEPAQTTAMPPVAPATEPAEAANMPVNTEAPRRTLELGVALAPGVLFGLGAPPAGAGLAGGGGGLRLDLKLGRGVLLGAGFRGLVRLRDGLALGRFRGALTVGYLLRRGACELAAQAGPTLETWQVREGGAPVAYTTTSSGGASLLLGGLARVALGGRVSRPRVSARLGGYVELAGSARASGRVPQIARGPGLAPMFVLGGAELSLGLEVELWFVLRPARDRRAAHGGARTGYIRARRGAS